MSKLIDLKKKVGIVLEKRNVSQSTRAQVAVAFDVTGSMQGLYSRGTVQELAERLLAVALRFDDNGSLDSWAFCEESTALAPVTESNFANYVQKEMLEKPGVQKWGSTYYAPALEDISTFYFGSFKTVVTEKIEKAAGFFGKLFGNKTAVQTATQVQVPGQSTSTLPVYVMFVTDGENFDEEESWKVLRQLANKNIYVEFVGIGKDRFKFCQAAADELGNVGFVRVNDITKISDEELYDTLLNEEFCEWIKK